jgi:Domain of unknown function (DUF4214)
MNTRTAVITGLMLSFGAGGTVLAQSPYRWSTSQRYAASSERQAARMVRQAYRDILRREPDASGLQQYTRAVLDEGWSEADVRRSLMSSDEYAQRGLSAYGSSRRAYRSAYRDRYASTAQAESIVRSAYLSVLGREPDAVGMRDYTTRVLRDGWSERDVVRSLRSSDEYRYRIR